MALDQESEPEPLRQFKAALGQYQHLTVEDIRAASGNTVSTYLVVSRKMKLDHDFIGPHDAVRLVADCGGKYKVLVYDRILEEGDIKSPSVSTILSQMNEPSWTICPGVSEYDSFKSAIGYDIKGVTVRNWPPNTVCDTQCQFWYHKSATQQSDLCTSCTQLKWKLAARKREHESLSAAEKDQRSEATSKYPFHYLSPNSQQLKVQKMRRAISDVNMLVKRTVSRIDRLSLTDEQNSEISELVKSIQSSSEGQTELQRIYSEAEQSGEGRGAILRALWENDASDMNLFIADQQSNGNTVIISISVNKTLY